MCITYGLQAKCLFQSTRWMKLRLSLWLMVSTVQSLLERLMTTYSLTRLYKASRIGLMQISAPS